MDLTRMLKAASITRIDAGTVYDTISRVPDTNDTDALHKRISELNKAFLLGQIYEAAGAKSGVPTDDEKQNMTSGEIRNRVSLLLHDNNLRASYIIGPETKEESDFYTSLCSMVEEVKNLSIKGVPKLVSDLKRINGTVNLQTIHLNLSDNPGTVTQVKTVILRLCDNQVAKGGHIYSSAYNHLHVEPDDNVHLANAEVYLNHLAILIATCGLKSPDGISQSMWLRTLIELTNAENSDLRDSVLKALALHKALKNSSEA